MIKLLIIADDFTGGLDTGVQFAAKGISTIVVTHPDADYQQAAGESEVLVVVAETRHLPPQEAAEMVSRVAKKGAALNIPYFYKKTDSALRGNIGAELAAMLEATGHSTLYFLPAMPSLHRVTVQGMHYVDGLPVAESVFGQDPFEPVTESSIPQLLHQQTVVPVHSVSPDCIPDEPGIVVIDASSEADLRTAGQALRESGRLCVTAGCAGFAGVLPEFLGLECKGKPQMPALPGNLFVLCGSVNPITQRQLAEGEAGGFTRVHLTPEQKLDREYFDGPKGASDLKTWQQMAGNTSFMILDANDEQDDNAATAAYAAEHGMDMETVRQRISGTLGTVLPKMLEAPGARTLLITGGDTLLQCMNHMGVHQMKPLLELFPGVVVSRFGGSQAHYVVTKSGGFGSPTLLCDLKSLLQGTTVQGGTL